MCTSWHTDRYVGSQNINIDYGLGSLHTCPYDPIFLTQLIKIVFWCRIAY